MESQITITEVKINIGLTIEELNKLNHYIEATKQMSTYINELVGDDIKDFINSFDELIKNNLEELR